MKRTTVQLEIEIEGATVSGDNLVNWLTERNQRAYWRYVEDRFRVVNARVLSEDR